MTRRGTRRDEEFVDFATSSSPRLQQAAYLMCRDWHLAQDLTQDTLAKVYLAWGRINRAADDRYTYARTVLLRQLLDHKRLRRSAETAVADPGEAAGPADEPATRLSLLAALSRLPVRDRAIVVLRYWEDQSVEATARTLNLSTAVVRTQSLRSLQLLREHLSAERDVLLQ